MKKRKIVSSIVLKYMKLTQSTQRAQKNLQESTFMTLLPSKVGVLHLSLFICEL